MDTGTSRWLPEGIGECTSGATRGRGVRSLEETVHNVPTAPRGAGGHQADGGSLREARLTSALYARDTCEMTLNINCTRNKERETKERKGRTGG